LSAFNESSEQSVSSHVVSIFVFYYKPQSLTNAPSALTLFFIFTYCISSLDLQYGDQHLPCPFRLGRVRVASWGVTLVGILLISRLILDLQYGDQHPPRPFGLGYAWLPQECNSGSGYLELSHISRYMSYRGTPSTRLLPFQSPLYSSGACSDCALRPHTAPLSFSYAHIKKIEIFFYYSL
jgi:hypothetical protein